MAASWAIYGSARYILCEFWPYKARLVDTCGRRKSQTRVCNRNTYPPRWGETVCDLHKHTYWILFCSYQYPLHDLLSGMLRPRLLIMPGLSIFYLVSFSWDIRLQWYRRTTLVTHIASKDVSSLGSFTHTRPLITTSSFGNFRCNYYIQKVHNNRATMHLGTFAWYASPPLYPLLFFLPRSPHTPASPKFKTNKNTIK